MRDDWDEIADGSGFTDLVAALYWQALAEAFAETQAEVDRWLLGNGTGEPRGILALAAEPAEPTPVERALALLDPHLRACPLYDAGPPVVYPHTWSRP